MEKKVLTLYVYGGQKESERRRRRAGENKLRRLSLVYLFFSPFSFVSARRPYVDALVIGARTVVCNCVVHDRSLLMTYYGAAAAAATVRVC